MPGKSFEDFRFRNIHPNVLIGTASDRYAGWIGQIYTKGRYEERITRRTNKVGKQSFVEEVLPVESVEEYFEHFSVLEIDYTFYRLLRDKDGKTTQNYHVLRQYLKHVKEGDRLILKAPQLIFAQKFRRGDEFVPNEAYLNPEIFLTQFYQPALELLEPNLAGIVFEQEYQRRDDRVSVKEVACSLDKFFSFLPKDTRFHIEL